jgi:hypothetical protein
MGRFMDTVGDREYTMISSETWIDVKDLTVNIVKERTGVKVWIYERTTGKAEPLAVAEADYVRITNKRANVIPFFPKGTFNDPKR